MLTIRQIPCLSDNYAFLARDEDTGATVSIDSPDREAILGDAQAAGWTIDAVWNTHWHADHAGGNAALVEATGARVTGPAEIARIAAAPDVTVSGGETIALGSMHARVLAVPGHTLGHVAYVFDEAGAAFVGDALFAMGCGRLFEGSAAQMWDSLQLLAALPPETTLYCAHEYTQANARFALSVDPENQALKQRALEVDALRANGLPTVPTTVALELATNPFLRAALIMPDRPPAEAFAELRRRKDTFR